MRTRSNAFAVTRQVPPSLETSVSSPDFPVTICCERALPPGNGTHPVTIPEASEAAKIRTARWDIGNCVECEERMTTSAEEHKWIHEPNAYDELQSRGTEALPPARDAERQWQLQRIVSRHGTSALTLRTRTHAAGVRTHHQRTRRPTSSAVAL